MHAMVESLRIALTGLAANRLRTALTMLGITIGVAAVVVLVSLGQAVQAFVEEQFLGIGTNLVFVVPESLVNTSGIASSGSMDMSRLTSSSSLTEKDVDALSDPFRVPDAVAVVPELRLSRTATYGDLQARGRIRATTPAYVTTLNRAVALGRFFD